MSVAALGTMPGVLLLAFRDELNDISAFIVIVVCAIAAACLFNMAETSAGVLADVRAQLVRGVGEPPFDADGNPRPVSTEPPNS
jgi:hypothetical protein